MVQRLFINYYYFNAVLSDFNLNFAESFNRKIMFPTGALFDLDGVLIDSETLYTKFWDEMGKTHELPSPTFAHDIKGMTLKRILDDHFPDSDVRADVVARLHDFEDNVYYPIFDGVAEFLAMLRENGVKTAVVTSSDDTKMNYLFRQHPDFRAMFDCLVTGSEVTKSKPDPEGYLLGADRIGIDIHDCVVFEDSYQGLEAGRRSGAVVIALDTTNPADTLTDKADLVISGFSGLTLEDLLQLRESTGR